MSSVVAVVDARQMQRDGRKLGVKTRNIYNAYGVVAYKRKRLAV